MQYWAVVAENYDGAIVGVGQITRFKTNINGEEKWVAYMSDLRISRSASPEVHAEWLEVYESLVKHLESPESEEHCAHVIVAILSENTHAIQVFERRLKGIKHNNIRPYWTVSVFSTLLSKRTREGSVSTTNLTQLESLDQPSLTMTDLPQGGHGRRLAVLDDNGTPVMGTTYWNFRGARSLRVVNLRWALRLGFKILNLFSSRHFSEECPWIMNGLGNLVWNRTTTIDEKANALAKAIHFAFEDDETPFHILNISLTDRNLCRQVQRCFPISRLTAGWIIEVTSSDRMATLPSENLTFEGAFL
ncbi:MAG: hypothetical protein AAB250_03075 [Bdellovibrionota bacterium]